MDSWAASAAVFSNTMWKVQDTPAWVYSTHGQAKLQQYATVAAGGCNRLTAQLHAVQQDVAGE